MEEKKERDLFIESEVNKILQMGEVLITSAYVLKQPGLLWQIILLGPLFVLLMTKAYYMAITNRRVILFKTKTGFWAPPMEVKEKTEYDRSLIRSVKTSGFANNRSFTLFFQGGDKLTLRFAPWLKFVSGNKTLVENLEREFPKA